ncbi:MAG: hypothetical protein M0Q91_14000 [Methanoregula sp.]|jgi:hypothetical protein|nr:hypothetical protein [Methanoregula sp.]
MKVRVTHPIPPELNHNCDLMHIESYQLEEVMLPATKREPARKAIHIVIQGRNFRAVAQPLFAFVGKIPVRYLQIAPDERSVDGVLLDEPEAGSSVKVILGDEDTAQHPTPFKPVMIRRIDRK